MTPNTKYILYHFQLLNPVSLISGFFRAIFRPPDRLGQSDSLKIPLPHQIASDFDDFDAVWKLWISAFRKPKFCHDPMRSQRINERSQLGLQIPFWINKIGFDMGPLRLKNRNAPNIYIYLFRETGMPRKVYLSYSRKPEYRKYI